MLIRGKLRSLCATSAGRAASSGIGVAGIGLPPRESQLAELSKTRKAVIGAFGRRGNPHTVPAIALQAALKKAGKDIDDLGLLEINEAFASVAVHANRMLGTSDEIVNVNGNSVALGHALGSTGARMVVTLVHEMRRRQVDYGGATLRGDGGQGYALVLRLPSTA
jgi:acetyl-CoA C-acetyltransferase